MNCYRCGYELTGERCLVCGKFAPTTTDPIGADANDLRIAVIVPAVDSVPADALDRLREKAVHYHSSKEPSLPGHVFVFTPHEAAGLFELLQATENVRERTILFNGRRRPYDADLWLPLLWFMTS